jgi:hypothetical protein
VKPIPRTIKHTLDQLKETIENVQDLEYARNNEKLNQDLGVIIKAMNQVTKDIELIESKKEKEGE